MTCPPPEPRPLVPVRAARILARHAGRAWPTWILDLFCGHTVRRKSAVEPKRARCDACAELARARGAAAE